MGCTGSKPVLEEDELTKELVPSRPAYAQLPPRQQGRRPGSKWRTMFKSQEQMHIRHISEPTGGPILVPRSQRGPDGKPVRFKEVELSRTQLHQAMHLAARYLCQKGQSSTIIAVGGAVNTMLLRTRDTTHDLDFFHESYRSPELHLLNEAGQYAISHSQVPLGNNWLNNTTILHVPAALQKRLTKEAMEQNEIIFREPGLTVYAAPWEYAFSAKLDRMGKPNRRPYDMHDATMYLRRYIEVHRVPEVSIGDVKQWAASYGTRATDRVVREVDKYYHGLYRIKGITGSDCEIGPVSGNDWIDL